MSGSMSMPGMPAAPMPPALGGGTPGMAPPRPNLGPVTQPQGNPGNAAAAMLDVKNAHDLLQRALPNIPMGTPIHTKVLKILTQLSEISQDAGGDQSLQMQSLLSMMRQKGQNPMAGALARLQPSPAAPPAMAPPPLAGMPE